MSLKKPQDPTATPTNTPVPIATSTSVPTATSTPEPTQTEAPTVTSTPVPTIVTNPDVNDDGVVDQKDLMLLMKNWHKEVE